MTPLVIGKEIASFSLFCIFFLLFETALLFAEKNQTFPLSVEKVDGKMYSNEFG